MPLGMVKIKIKSRVVADSTLLNRIVILPYGIYVISGGRGRKAPPWLLI